MSRASAAASYLGYEYQALQALLLVLPSGSNSKIFIERFDDVEFENDENNSKLIIQTKFSLNDHTRINAKDYAFWNTIRNWIALIDSNIVTDDHLFLIITTRKTDDELILSFTKNPRDRENNDLLKEFIEFAEEIKNDNNSTKNAIKQFLELHVDKQFALIEKIHILTSQPNIEEIQQKINNHLKDWSRDTHLEGFLDSIYGWWYREIIKRLSKNVHEPLTHADLMAAIDYHRGSQSAKSLPVYFNHIPDKQKIIDEHKKRNFVKQLDWIKLDEGSVTSAMFDYYLASEHRSRWVREMSYVSDKLSEYDQEISEKWKSEFNSKKREIKKLNISDDELLIPYGVSMFEWMDRYSNYPDITLDKSVAKIWLWKGSSHMLSDIYEIGWHPNFKELSNGEKNDN